MTSYDASKGDIEVPLNKFNKKFYDNHPADSVFYRGVGYSETTKKYYVVTNGFNVITCDPFQNFRESAPVGLATCKHEETNIVLPKRPEVEGTAMFYYRRELDTTRCLRRYLSIFDSKSYHPQDVFQLS